MRALHRGMVGALVLLGLSVLPPYMAVLQAAIARVSFDRLEFYPGQTCDGTTTYTCYDIDGGSGSDRALVLAAGIPTSDLLTGATYGGTAMTCPAGANIGDAGDRRVQLCYLLGHATGLNNIVLTYSSTPDVRINYVAFYTGVGSMEAVGEDTNAGATSLAVTFTTTANARLVAYLRESSGTSITWTNGITTEMATTSGAHLADSAGVTINAGSTTITATAGTAVVTALVALSLSEAGGGGATPCLRMLLGVGKC